MYNSSNTSQISRWSSYSAIPNNTKGYKHIPGVRNHFLPSAVNLWPSKSKFQGQKKTKLTQIDESGSTTKGTWWRWRSESTYLNDLNVNRRKTDNTSVRWFKVPREKKNSCSKSFYRKFIQPLIFVFLTVNI